MTNWFRKTIVCQSSKHIGSYLATQIFHCLHNARHSGKFMSRRLKIYLAKVTSKQLRKLEPGPSLLLSARLNAMIYDINFPFLHEYLFLVCIHYNDGIMSTMAYLITSLTIVYSTVYSGTKNRIHQISASLVFVSGTHRWPMYSPHKEPVTRKMFLFDDVIIKIYEWNEAQYWPGNDYV